jgi:Putative porin
MRQSTHWSRTCVWLSVGLGLGVLQLADAINTQAQTLEERVQRIEAQLDEKIAKLQLPAWVKIFQFSGDFRLRYQYENETEEEERHRGRFRYRLNIDANILDNLKVGFGLTSGGEDPRSTNESFRDTFSGKNVRLDLAFVEYKPTAWFDIIGGKFKNPLWTPSDWLWDTDIRPEGGAIFLHDKLPPQLEFFVVSGAFVLDEVSDGADPLLVPLQGGVTFALMKQVAIQFAATYYEFLDVQGATLDFSAGTNTLAGEVLAFDYNVVSVSAELGFTKIFGDVIPYIGLIGEYVHNFDPDNANDGYLAGIKVGHKRIREQGSWQVQYLYRRLERDAWLDTFPDADFLNGETNAQGHEVILTYGIVKYVEVGIDYYHAEEITGSRKKDAFQFDVVFKFP